MSNPGEDAYLVLNQALAAMISVRGEGGFLRHRLDPLLPSSDFFPDPWQRSLLGVARVLHRLLGYAGLGDQGFRLDDGRDPLSRLTQSDADSASIHFVDIVNGDLIFSVQQLGPAQEVLAVLAREVALVSVVLDRGRLDPYRSRKSEDDALAPGSFDEYAAEAQAAIGYLGFQVLDLLGMHALVATHSVFLLGVAMTVYADPKLEERIMPELVPVHAQELEAWLAEMKGDRASLCEVLGLSEPAQWAEACAREVGPGFDDAVRVAELEALDAHYQTPMRGTTTVVYTQSKAVSYAIVGGLIAVMPFIFLVAIGQPAWLGALLLVGLIGVGAAVGSGRQIEYCGKCNMIANEGELSCRGCAAILGERRVYSAAAPEDDDDDE